jgi:hypothetical protein
MNSGYIYILGTNNIQHLKDFAIPLLLSFLPSLPALSNVCVRGERRAWRGADVECD